MKEKEYLNIVESKSIKENKIKNIIIAFIFGGFMGLFGQIITTIFNKYIGMSLSDAYMYTMVIIVILASLLTGFGFFDKLVSFAKAGLLVPTTGFANAMTSSAMDARKEGLIKGIGANIFKLTGSVILYALVSGVLFAIIMAVIS